MPGQGNSRRLSRGAIVGASVATAAGAMLAFSAYMADKITRPRRIMPIAVHEIEPSLEAITFHTADGLMLHGWYLPHDAPHAALIIAHGYSMNRGELLDLARGMRGRGYATLLFDFRAHGASEGKRSTIGFREAGDVAAAARFLHAQPTLAGCAIGAIGLSMGAVATIGAAIEEPLIAAVVSDSGYATLSEIAAGGLRLLFHLPAFPFAPLVIRFSELLTRARIGAASPVDIVAQIAPRPILFIHGSADRLIPLANAHALYAAANEPKELWIVPGVAHASAYHQVQDEYLRRLDRFFTTTLVRPTGEGEATAARAARFR
ncbi:MAG TPA: alpha/beta hydrolase [Thermomicrobiales bacterium]|jgi:fermentation-respiration switch protein FrsA (DUF1100 family)